MNLRFIFWFDDFTLQVEMSGVLKRGYAPPTGQTCGKKASIQEKNRVREFEDHFIQRRRSEMKPNVKVCNVC